MNKAHFDEVWHNALSAQRRYYGEEPAINDRRTADLLQACMVECAEALQTMPSQKAWNRGERATDRADLLNEIADIQLFILACAIWQGMSQDDFMQAVADKQAYNSRRADHRQNSSKIEQADALAQTASLLAGETACE